MLRRYIVIAVILLSGCLQPGKMEKYTINISYDAQELSSEEVETEIVVPVEGAVENLGGIEHINYTAMNGRAEIEVVLSSLKTEEEILRSIEYMLAGKQGTLPQNFGVPDVFVVGEKKGCTVHI